MGQDKGFGFISPDDGGDDCFAHVKDSPELENCQQGDSVSFDKVWDDRKGKYKAENVSGGSGGGGGGWESAVLQICTSALRMPLPRELSVGLVHITLLFHKKK